MQVCAPEGGVAEFATRQADAFAVFVVTSNEATVYVVSAPSAVNETITEAVPYTEFGPAATVGVPRAVVAVILFVTTPALAVVPPPDGVIEIACAPAVP